MGNLFALIFGFVFALGLGISGMTKPTKVIGFLDLFGSWDPSLMFVMVGAIIVNSVIFVFSKSMAKPLLEKSFALPSKRDLEPNLIIGSALFGIGWGLAGYCPGPGIVSLASLAPNAFYFVGSLIVGMLIFQKTHKDKV